MEWGTKCKVQLGHQLLAASLELPLQTGKQKDALVFIDCGFFTSGDEKGGLNDLGMTDI